MLQFLSVAVIACSGRAQRLVCLCYSLHKGHECTSHKILQVCLLRLSFGCKTDIQNPPLYLVVDDSWSSVSNSHFVSTRLGHWNCEVPEQVALFPIRAWKYISRDTGDGQSAMPAGRLTYSGAHLSKTCPCKGYLCKVEFTDVDLNNTQPKMQFKLRCRCLKDSLVAPGEIPRQAPTELHSFLWKFWEHCGSLSSDDEKFRLSWFVSWNCVQGGSAKKGPPERKLKYQT